MSKERIQIAPELFDIMPPEYQDLVNRATYGNANRGWKDIGTSKELSPRTFALRRMSRIDGVSINLA